jgi:hypothetical protein
MQRNLSLLFNDLRLSRIKARLQQSSRSLNTLKGGRGKKKLRHRNPRDWRLAIIKRLRRILLSQKWTGFSNISLITKDYLPLPGNLLLMWKSSKRRVFLGALCSNDAKSCYDRIAHNIAAISMQRMGVPLKPLASMFLTLQKASHAISTAYGVSSET